MRGAARREAGFTLVEIIVATILVSTVFSLLMAGFVTANRWTNPETNVAHEIARERLEELMEYVRQDRWEDVTSPINPTFDAPATTHTLDGVVYTRDYALSDVPAGTTPRRYRKAEVDVTWG